MTQKKIAAARKRIEKKIQHAEQSLYELQDECTHPAAVKKHGGSTGNYDPSADCYWTDWKCPDCGKRWTTPQ